MKNTMPKECAINAIIEMVGPRWLLSAFIKINLVMQKACVKAAIRNSTLKTKMYL